MNEHGAGLPAWVSPLAWAYIALTAISTATMLYLIFVRGPRQRSRIMELAWLLGATYLGPVALWMFQRAGEPRPPVGPGIDASPGTGHHATRRHDSDTASGQRAAVRGGLLGGAASAIAHLVGVPLVLLTGLTLAGDALWAMIAVITLLAVAVLTLMEHSLRQRRASTAGGAGSAVAVAFLTVLAFDVGMLGWMLVLHFAGLMPHPTDVSFVFLMQVGLVLGLIAGYPAVSVLLRRGLKTPA
ncbi:DUF4396 domain-containing protein [Kineococcus xinjiangensis]|nr:DUF4396 domain-containing protein [Kineococcus xinjiangensis]